MCAELHQPLIAVHRSERTVPRAGRRRHCPQSLSRRADRCRITDLAVRRPGCAAGLGSGLARGGMRWVWGGTRVRLRVAAGFQEGGGVIVGANLWFGSLLPAAHCPQLPTTHYPLPTALPLFSSSTIHRHRPPSPNHHPPHRQPASLGRPPLCPTLTASSLMTNRHSRQELLRAGARPAVPISGFVFGSSVGRTPQTR